jgi:hypothetical protein
MQTDVPWIDDGRPLGQKAAMASQNAGPDVVVKNGVKRRLGPG